jgi:hypothetical protein
MAIVKDIVDRLRARAGDKLGGPPA